MSINNGQNREKCNAKPYLINSLNEAFFGLTKTADLTAEVVFSAIQRVLAKIQSETFQDYGFTHIDAETFKKALDHFLKDTVGCSAKATGDLSHSMLTLTSIPSSTMRINFFFDVGLDVIRFAFQIDQSPPLLGSIGPSSKVSKAPRTPTHPPLNVESPRELDAIVKDLELGRILPEAPLNCGLGGEGEEEGRLGNDM